MEEIMEDIKKDKSHQEIVGKRDLSCERCNLSLIKRQKRFCSNKCKDLSNITHKHFICRVCGKRFYRRLSQAKKGWGKYCSHRCSSIGRSKQITRICVVCGKKFFQKPSKMTDERGFVCSRPCYYIRQCGMIQKNNQGKTNLQYRVRKLFEYRQWRSDVFKRDEYTCQSCGKEGGWLEAHHEITLTQLFIKYNIKTVEQARKESALWDINNGITYCEFCHKIVHGINKIEKTVNNYGK